MPNLALDLGDKVASFGVTSAYGAAQEVAGVTLIPVAITWSGFGGGSDSDGNGGGGGGGYAFPVGAYVKRADDLRFEPNVVALLAVAVPFIWVTGKALKGLIRALKK